MRAEGPHLPRRCFNECESTVRSSNYRIVSLLAEAADNEFDRDAFDGNAAARQHMIDHLDSLGYIEARCGLPDSGEDEDLYYLDGITSLGRAALAELQRNLNVEAGRASDADVNRTVNGGASCFQQR